jgi:hypothetical protein
MEFTLKSPVHLFKDIQEQRAQLGFPIFLQRRRRLVGVHDLRLCGVKGRAEASRGWDFLLGRLTETPPHFPEQHVRWLDQREQALEMVGLVPRIVGQTRTIIGISLKERAQLIPQIGEHGFLLGITRNPGCDEHRPDIELRQKILEHCVVIQEMGDCTPAGKRFVRPARQ